MLYIPLRHLKPGMVLAEDLPSSQISLSLITAGQTLSEASIRQLERHGLQGAYVVSAPGDELPNSFLDPEFKRGMLQGIKKKFEEFNEQATIGGSSYREMARMASDLVGYILSDDRLFVNMVDIRDYDNYTYSHSLSVGLISTLIGIRQGMSRSSLESLAMCGLLHDIGKLDIPLSIVNKPGPLTDEEMEAMRSHPTRAVKRLQANRFFSSVILKGIESHHERFDGSGYPSQLKGRDIPLYARILALADVYDALTSRRSYRQAWDTGTAIEYMIGSSDRHFDHELLETFLNVVYAYPTGTIVRLSNGDMAIVISNTPGQALRPTVRVIEPSPRSGAEINLAMDMSSYSITVLGCLRDEDPLPQALCPK